MKCAYCKGPVSQGISGRARAMYNNKPYHLDCYNLLKEEESKTFKGTLTLASLIRFHNEIEESLEDKLPLTTDGILDVVEDLKTYKP